MKATGIYNITSGVSYSYREICEYIQSYIDCDIIVFIQPTSPLLTSLDINQGLDLMLSNEYNSICSVYEEHWVPRWTESMAPYNWDINNRPRRQDMPKLFVENGAFYITKKEDSISTFENEKPLKDLEKKIYEEIKLSNPEIIDSINNTGKLDNEVEKKLVSIIEQFKKNNK